MLFTASVTARSNGQPFDRATTNLDEESALVGFTEDSMEVWFGIKGIEAEDAIEALEKARTSVVRRLVSLGHRWPHGFTILRVQSGPSEDGVDSPTET